MGLFEDLGRKVETFKQQATDASEAQAVGECADCGALLYTEREDCPDCGSERIHRREGDETGSSSTDGTGSSSTDGTGSSSTDE